MRVAEVAGKTCAVIFGTTAFFAGCAVTNFSGSLTETFAGIAVAGVGGAVAGLQFVGNEGDGMPQQSQDLG